MKKLLLLLLTMLITFTTGMAATEINGIKYNLDSSARTAEVTYGSYSGSVSIPSYVYYNGTSYNVTSISNNAFNNCSNMTDISLPNSITNIGDAAFISCTGLVSISIPNKVTTIGNSAFASCKNLESIVIPNSVTNIGKQVLTQCTSLASITVESGNTVYDSRDNCNAIIETSSNKLLQGCKNSIIPETVTAIGDHAFAYCYILSINIPNSVTSIGNNAFYYCTSLKSINIPNSVTSLGIYAFNHCSYMTSAIIGNGVTSIEDATFSECSKLETLTIGDHVNSIGISAFYNCSKLSSVVIPNSVKTIGKTAFAINTAYTNDHGLSSVTFGNGLTDVGENAFQQHYYLRSIYISDLTAWCNINWANGLPTTYDLYLNNVKVTELSIPDGLTEIKPYAFNNCRSCSSITIPSNVSSIGDYAFSGSNLSSVTVENPIPVTITQYVFSNRANITLYVPYGRKTAYEAADYWKEFKEIVDPAPPSPNITFADANVKALCVANWDINGDGELSEAEAELVTDLGTIFKNNHSITSFDELQYFTGLTSIVDIMGGTFYGCNSLTSIIIPNSVTTIDRTFNLCTSLTSITIPNNVTNILDNPVGGCDGLTSIFVASGNTKYDSRDNCNAIIETSSNTLIAGCKNTVIPNSVTSIGRSAFANLSVLNSITIPNSVTSIGEFAFISCSGLTSITIPNSVTSIGNYAFSNCTSLTSVIIENPTPVTIDSYTFTNRTNATLYVPYGSKSAYEAASYWKEFKQIIEVDNRPEQTLSYAEIPTKTYGDAAFTLPSTTTGGLAITWASSNTNVATISGNTVTIKGAGSATITATQEGNDDYKPFTVDFALTVSKAPLTVTAKSYTIKQGDTMPTFEATYSGFKNNETASVLTTQPTFSCSATSASAPGTYDITVSGATASNYSITFAKGTLTITQADPVTVTANSYTIQYGDAIPTLGYTTNGAILNGTPALSCSATASSPAGTYPITITTGSVSNYNVTYVAGTLTITKAPLTISAKSYTIMQGEAMPTFEATYSGFKNNDDQSVLTTVPTFSCSATSTSAPGTYDIIVSGAEADNYDITYVNGTLTLQASNITITIPTEGMTTYCPSYNLDFSGVTGFKAYVIVGYNKKTNKVVAVEVSEASAGTGLYLAGTPGSYEVPLGESDTYYMNMLKGVTIATTIPATNGDFANLTLSSATTPTFAPASDGSSVDANTAYLQIETAKYNGQPIELLLMDKELLGDINKDGYVTIVDVTMLVDIILNQ